MNSGTDFVLNGSYFNAGRTGWLAGRLSSESFNKAGVRMVTGIDVDKLVDDLPREIDRYFGAAPGGYNLRGSIDLLPAAQMAEFAGTVLKQARNGGRVFFCGNGGSFDNARLLAQMFSSVLSKVGATQIGCARTPGDPLSYDQTTQRLGYDQIFVEGLRSDGLRREDIVVGISGSGNSPNVLEAFKYAQSVGARIFAFGGRDGGKMAKLAGTENSLIVANQSMEAIEDLHVLLGQIVVAALSSEKAAGGNIGSAIETEKAKLLAGFDTFASIENRQAIKLVASGLLNGLFNNARDGQNPRVFILGTNIGANHLRADWGRGITNNIPLPGILVPEFYSCNSWMATLNDDGPSYGILHALKSMKADARDFALLIDSAATQKTAAAMRGYLERNQVPFVEVSDQASGAKGSTALGRLNTSSLPSLDLGLSILGHVCSQCVRDVLWRVFDVREFNVPADLAKTLPDILAGDRKLAEPNLLGLERELRAGGQLAEDRVLTVAYGTILSAKDPALLGLQRGF